MICDRAYTLTVSGFAIESLKNNVCMSFCEGPLDLSEESGMIILPIVMY